MASEPTRSLPPPPPSPPFSLPGLLREAPGSTGMLVVESVVPGGPSDGVLEPGDVVVRLGGAIVSEFLSVEEALDGAGGVGWGVVAG